MKKYRTTRFQGVRIFIAIPLFITFFALFTAACSDSGDSSPNKPAVGEVIHHEVKKDGSLVYESLYDFWEFDSEGNLIPYQGGDYFIAIFRADRIYDLSLQTVNSSSEHATVESVQQFVKDEWIPYLRKKDKSQGEAVADFIDFFRVKGDCDIDSFLAFYNNSGLTVDEYVEFLEGAYNFYSKDNASLGNFISFLDFLDTSLKEFETELSGIGTDAPTFFEKAKGYGYDYFDFYNTYGPDDWSSLSSFLEAILDGTLEKPLQASALDAGQRLPGPTGIIDSIFFALDMIKMISEGQPTKPDIQGGSLSFISPRQKDILNYTGSSTGESSVWESSIGPGCKIKFRVCYTYNAKGRNITPPPPEIAGYYISKIYGEYPEVTLWFTCRMNGIMKKTDLKNLNPGSAWDTPQRPPNPYVTVMVVMMPRILGAFGRNDSFSFEIQGNQGLKKEKFQGSQPGVG